MLPMRPLVARVFVSMSAFVTVVAAAQGSPIATGAPPPLELESKIPLGNVRGRIDHLAIDLRRARLYVAELGNDSIGVVDLNGRAAVRTLTGLREPQGIAYVASTDTVYVANAGDGTVRMFRGGDLMPAGQISLGDDADNVRVDDAVGRVFVGYGNGALAVIDAVTQEKVADIALKAHPESFQLEKSGSRLFVNVPDAREITVVDRATLKHVASWDTAGLRANFALALDEAGHVLAVFRQPARLGVFDAHSGRRVTDVETCGDSDDAFVDPKRARIYVTCGQGFIDVFSSDGNTYRRVARVTTVAGARTSLFVPERDRLYLAVRATAISPAFLWVFCPTS